MIFQECFALNVSLLFLFLFFRYLDMREMIFREAMAVACLDSMYVISYNFFFFFRFFFVVKMCLVSQKTVWEKKSFAFESENENPCETLKCLRARIFFFFFFLILWEGLGWIWLYCFWVKWDSMVFWLKLNNHLV